jgi:hypothetical protein
MPFNVGPSGRSMSDIGGRSLGGGSSLGGSSRGTVGGGGNREPANAGGRRNKQDPVNHTIIGNTKPPTDDQHPETPDANDPPEIIVQPVSPISRAPNLVPLTNTELVRRSKLTTLAAPARLV